MNMLTFGLLVVFEIKHFVADYMLQTTYMLGKGKKGNEWILPLSAHCGVHALHTLVIVFIYTGSIYKALAATVFDFVTHFIMDRVKASPDMLGRFNPSQAEFWQSLGLDQGVHHIIHFLIILIFMS